MLEILLEFRKGILFVRMSGELKKETVSILQTEVTDTVLKNGIQNIVFNIEQLTQIDMKGMSALLYHYEICKSRKGNCYICNIPSEIMYLKLKKNRILNYIHEMDNELTILHTVTV